MKLPAAFKGLRGFTVTPGVSAWVLECKRCGARWAYPIAKEPPLGAASDLRSHPRTCTARQGALL